MSGAPHRSPTAAVAATATLAATLLLTLGGCGQTGPLYLPDSGTVVTRPAPAATPAAPATPAATPAAPATPTTTPPATPPTPAPKPGGV